MKTKFYILLVCLLPFFSLVDCSADGVELDSVTVANSVPVCRSKEDSIREHNEKLYHAFFLSLAWVESRHKSKVTSDRNADGQRSYGWVQITPIFVLQANMNRHFHETGKYIRTPKRYYSLQDASNFDKSKEIVYWVNKKTFDLYDKCNRMYDIHLWRKVLKNHNPTAKSGYHNQVIAEYRKKVRDLQD